MLSEDEKLFELAHNLSSSKMGTKKLKKFVFLTLKLQVKII